MKFQIRMDFEYRDISDEFALRLARKLADTISEKADNQGATHGIALMNAWKPWEGWKWLYRSEEEQVAAEAQEKARHILEATHRIRELEETLKEAKEILQGLLPPVPIKELKGEE